MRRKTCVVLTVLMFSVAGCGGPQRNQNPSHNPVPGPDTETAVLPGENDIEPIPDPLEPINRVFFQFNDRLYFWVLKPVAQGYNFVVPRRGRRGVRNFFTNLSTPIRAVNCLLQGHFRGTGIELTRFGVNSTVGVLGFADPATEWGLEHQRRDFGQTLGLYGLGPGIYIVWPVLGPSSVRGTAGRVGDGALSPLAYYPPSLAGRVGLHAYERINDTSLRIGEYEAIKQEAFLPYVAIRSGFHEHREYRVREARQPGERQNGR